MTAGTPTWRLVGWAATVVLAAAGVAQWWFGSPPLALLAASYVAVLGLLSRALPVRVALSAALLVQQAVLLAMMLLVPLVLGGPLRPGVALAVLLVPCLALVPDLLLGRRDETGEPLRVPLAVLAAACTGAVVLVVTVLLAGRDDSFGRFAWSGSGDARLHLLFARAVLEEGGLRGLPFSEQPQYQEAFTALLLDTHGRGALSPGALLEHDLRGTGTVATGLTVLWTLSTSAALAGLGALRGRGAAVVVAVASLLPVTGLALGVLLRDGFLPILLLVPLLLCSLTVLGWLHTTDRGSAAVTTGVVATAAAIPVLAFVWTPHAVVVGVAALLPWLRALRSGEQRTPRLAAMAVGAGSGAAYCLYVVVQGVYNVQILGAIAAPSPVTVVLVPVLVLGIVLGRWSALDGRALWPYLAGTVAAAAITAYGVLAQPEGVPWNYYPAKVAWTWLLVGLPFLLVPFAHPRTAPGLGRTAVAGVTGVLLGALALSPVTSPVLPHPVSWLQSGQAPTHTMAAWDQPDIDSLRLAVSLGHPRNRYVVYAVSPPDDRLTNFWLSAYDRIGGSVYHDEFLRWGYRETGTLAEVCELLVLQPYRVVATADPTMEQQLRQECGRKVPVRLVPAPSV